MRPPVIAILFVLAALPVRAQTLQAPAGIFSGGVPSGQTTADTLTLTPGDVIRRALDNNLGVLAAQEGVDRARGARWQALSELLPNVSGRVAEVRQKVSLEVFGLPLGPEFPRVSGPFNVFDARLHVSQSLFDWSAINRARAGAHALQAERHDYRNARDLVVLVAANLYLQTLESQARADAARARLETSRALHAQALDLRQNGVVAGIDVVRAEVRLSTDRQTVTSAENEFQKRKLQLARVIGLPIGQSFALEDLKVDVPMPELTLETALDRAYHARADFLAAQERVQAAEASSQAAHGGRLPSAHLTADYGAIGLSPSTSLSTFNVTGAISVPIFQGGRTAGEVIAADAALRQRRAEVEDMRAEIYYDVQTAFLDLRATGEELQTATRGRELADLQLAQARDRFAAGVANNVEVVQAQEAVALASEQYIAARYGFNLSKALLARSIGTAEDAVLRYLGEARP